MKKIVAVTLALLMAVSLLACGAGEQSQSQAGASPSSAAPSASPSPSAASSPADAAPAASTGSGIIADTPMDEIGFYDPEFDYFAGERYKVQYMSTTTGILYETNNGIYRNWAKLMNMEYGDMWCSNGDNDLFINAIGTFAEQGVDGLLLDPDLTIYPRIAEVCEEYKLQWMPCMGPPRDLNDPEMPLLHPTTGFDHYQMGVKQTEKLLDYAKNTWSDFDLNNTGFIALDYSVSQPIHDREVGAREAWLAAGGSEANYMVADTATGSLDMDTSYQKVNALISTSSHQYKYWLIAAHVDDLAQGAANAIDNLGLADVACVVAVGGPAAYAMWDKGQENAWKFVLATGNQLFGEPTMAALHAFMSGRATPDTIWPSWVDVNDHGGPNHSYAKLLLPQYWVDKDNYQAYLEWSDVYGYVDDYHYEVSGITRDSFPSRAEVPESYRIPKTAS